MESTTYNIACECEYIGTNYSGWQRQNNGSRAIQNVIEAELSKFYGEAVEITGSGRTDAGVHALGQVFNFHTRTYREPKSVMRYLNTYLPADVRINDACTAPADFHAWRSIISKTYLYRIINKNTPSAVEFNRALWVRKPVDIEKLHEILQNFVGEHDFAAFCVTKTKKENTTRRVNFIKVKACGETRGETRNKNSGLSRDAKASDIIHNLSGNLIEIEINANGFLHNMVRVIIGTALEILQSGTLQEDSNRHIQDILASRDRTLAGKTAPACGLYQMGVFYSKDKMGIRGIETTKSV